MNSYSCCQKTWGHIHKKPKKEKVTEREKRILKNFYTYVHDICLAVDAAASVSINFCRCLVMDSTMFLGIEGTWDLPSERQNPR
jgi:hypothetical protein